MNEGKKPTNQPSAHLGAVPPSRVDVQVVSTEHHNRFNQNCQVPSAVLQPGKHHLSPGATDTLFHALLDDAIRFLADRGVERSVADRIISAARGSLFKAAKQHRIASAEAALEFIAEALASRIAGLQIFPKVMGQVAAKSKTYAKRFVGPVANAEDCLQGALLLVHKNPGRFGAFTPEQAIGVLRGITKNMQREEFRDQQRVILAEGEEVAEQGTFTTRDNDGGYLETKQIAAHLECQAPREVRIAVEFLDRKAAGEDLNRTVIERASRARRVVATILETYGVDTRQAYRQRPSRTAAKMPLVERCLVDVQPDNDNNEPESTAVADDARVDSEEQPPPSSQVRRRS